MENILGALAMLIEQHRGNFGSRESPKAQRSVVDKIGKFDGKNITNFPRTQCFPLAYFSTR